MKNILKLIVGVSICLLASCTTAPQWGTPSGNPEVVVHGNNPQSKVVGRLVAKGWNIENQTPNLLAVKRQQLGRFNHAIVGGPGIVDGWNITFVPENNNTRAILGSTYLVTYNGKFSNVPTQKEGQEFLSTLSGL